MKKIYKEDLWKKIKEELESLSDDITMKQFFNSNVLNFNNLSDSLSFIISKFWAINQGLSIEKLSVFWLASYIAKLYSFEFNQLLKSNSLLP